jgi:hypothetical protein
MQPQPRPEVRFDASGTSKGDLNLGAHYSDPKRGMSAGAGASIPPTGAATVDADFAKRVGPNTTVGTQLQTGPSGNSGSIWLKHSIP